MRRLTILDWFINFSQIFITFIQAMEWRESTNDQHHHQHHHHNHHLQQYSLEQQQHQHHHALLSHHEMQGQQQQEHGSVNNAYENSQTSYLPGTLVSSLTINWIVYSMF